MPENQKGKFAWLGLFSFLAGLRINNKEYTLITIASYSIIPLFHYSN